MRARPQPVEKKALSLIPRLYSGTLTPADWESLLDEIAEYTGSLFASITHVSDLVYTSGTIVCSRLGRAAQRHYMEGGWRNDIYRDHTIHMREGETVRLTELVPLEVALASPWGDYMRKHDTYFGAFTVFRKRGAELGALTILRRESEGEAPDYAVKLLKLLGPHCATAFTMTRFVARLRHERDSAFQSLDALPYGVMLIDGDGRVRVASAVAREIAGRKRAPISLRGGRLTARNASDAVLLERTISRAAAAREKSGTARVALRLGTDGPDPVSVLIASHSFTFDVPQTYERNLVAYVFDVNGKAETPVDVLAEIYGLSAGEAKLAGLLMQGQTMKEAAKSLSISLNTVRERVSNIYLKVGVNRQSDLVRVLTRASLVLAHNREKSEGEDEDEK